MEISQRLLSHFNSSKESFTYYFLIGFGIVSMILLLYRIFRLIKFYSNRKINRQNEDSDILKLNTKFENQQVLLKDLSTAFENLKSIFDTRWRNNLPIDDGYLKLVVSIGKKKEKIANFDFKASNAEILYLKLVEQAHILLSEASFVLKRYSKRQ